MYIISQQVPRTILARFDTEAQARNSEVLQNTAEPLYIYRAVTKVSRTRGKSRFEPVDPDASE